MSPDPQDADDWKWIGYLPASAFAARAAKRDDGGLASAYVTLSETGYLLEAPRAGADRLRRSARRRDSGLSARRAPLGALARYRAVVTPR
ncbi:MAG: hypothetical protein U0326_17505 [Polyangiales bacterium]